jgi:hypothetical protein
MGVSEEVNRKKNVVTQEREILKRNREIYTKVFLTE